jgi:hypothetical protein
MPGELTVTPLLKIVLFEITVCLPALVMPTPALEKMMFSEMTDHLPQFSMP